MIDGRAPADLSMVRGHARWGGLIERTFVNVVIGLAHRDFTANLTVPKERGYKSFMSDCGQLVRCKINPRRGRDGWMELSER